jgi:Peptide-N-glycosidase F, C terminal
MAWVCLTLSRWQVAVATAPFCLAAALGCSSNSTPPKGVDASVADAGHMADAIPDRMTDAKVCPNADGPLTVPIATKVHLTQATPFVNLEATVPEGCWAGVKVQMTASSACSGTPPAGQNWPTDCDPYDRLAQVSLADPGKTAMFVLDAVTSFGGSAMWTQDVTDYASLLSGKHTYRVEIDTYSDSQGLVTGTASSHDVTVSILLTPGPPPHDVLLAVPLLRSDITGGGDAGEPMLSAKLDAPSGATQARFDYFTSGHGANGPEMECDEFCPKQNDVTLDGKSVYAKTPTSNCSDNCTHQSISGSISCAGMTFDYVCQQNPDACPPSATAPRSNWCPSQIISPIAIPLPVTALDGAHTAGVSIKNADGTWSTSLSAVFYR